MVDSIIACKVYKNPNGTVDRYDIEFQYDFALLPSMGTPTITVFASEMIDSTDLNEVKSLAITRAQESKQGYARECAMVVETIHTLDGNVTL